jgi:hypothetical protein
MEHLISAGRLDEAKRFVGTAQRIPQMPRLRPDNLERASRGTGVQAEIQLRLTGRDPSVATAFNAANSPASCAEPRCSFCREPHREDHTTCTAITPDAVRTVRTYATEAGYGPRLVRKSRPARPLRASKHRDPSRGKAQ